MEEKNIKGKSGLFFLCLFFIVFSSFLFPPSSFADSTKSLEEIPVQHGGRVKPFDGFARDVTRTLTGGASFENSSPTLLVWDWMANPDQWNTRAFIAVPRALHKEFGPMLVKGRLSPQLIQNSASFLEQVQTAWAKRQRKEILSPLEKYRLEIYDKQELFQKIASGLLPGFVPHPENPSAAWMTLQAFSDAEGRRAIFQYYDARQVQETAQALGALIKNFRKNKNSLETKKAAEDFSSRLAALRQSRGVILDQTAIQRELRYYRWDLFGWALKFYLVAAGLFIFLMTHVGARHVATDPPAPQWRASPLRNVALGIWLLGILIHFYGFFLRCLIAGRPPVTNMYESVIWVSWAVVFFAAILFAVYWAFSIPLAASLVASLALWIAQSFPAVLDPSISPLVPVLRSNMWLTIHVLTITMSYGAFALAWGLGHIVVFKMTLDSNVGARHVSPLLSSYLYRTLQIGVVLLATGTILGGVWANYSWGRFWGWDPKETWALIALLGYLIVLHGRFSGWLDTFSAAAGSVVAFLGVVMAWYGVNFVLAAGLHSYGFGGGGAPYVFGIALADLLLILGLSHIYKRKK